MWGETRVQLPSDGEGPLFHRCYYIDIARPRLTREALMARIQRDLPDFAPAALAAFRKVKGHPQRMQPGDEYDIRILGPWNGQVRVTEVTPTSFSFMTLAGHPEAGQITFAVQKSPVAEGALRFQIRSWARSRDMLVSLTYREGKIGKELQKNAWVTFCERVVKASGGQSLGEVTVETEERDFTGEVIPIV
ncbi:MAG: DUF1990 family protein [Chloroflexi bacterium OHK40]